MTDEEPPRMLLWGFLSLVVMALALFVRDAWPTSLAAVTLYKAHLLSLGGWAGYWLDRGLFPYDRPHEHLKPEGDDPQPGASVFGEAYLQAPSAVFGMSMMRRAVLVAACIVGVCLGA